MVAGAGVSERDVSSPETESGGVGVLSQKPEHTTGASGLSLVGELCGTSVREKGVGGYDGQGNNGIIRR